MRKTDPEIEKQIQKLYDEGFCDDEIANRMGKSKSTIGQWRKKKGLPLVFVNRKRLTKKESESSSRIFIPTQEIQKDKEKRLFLSAKRV